MTHHATSKLKINAILVAGFLAVTTALNVHAAGIINTLVATPGTPHETAGLQPSDPGMPVLGTDMNAGLPVSYTHLTLPTILLV